MVTEFKKTAKNLYETDYNLWVKETAILLETRSFNGLDLENLIEEILDLSERKKRKLESLLTRLWEHLLKIKKVPPQGAGYGNRLLANRWFPLQAYIFRPKGRGITPKLLLKLALKSRKRKGLME